MRTNRILDGQGSLSYVDPRGSRRFVGRSSRPAPASLILLFSATAACGQVLPQLQNGFRNTFSEAGAPADPEPPGPTARSAPQFVSGTAFGGWRATRLKDSDGNLLAGSTSEVPGDPGTVVEPGYTPVGADGVTPVPSQTITLRSAKIARPIVLRTVSFALGSEIPRPDRTPEGRPLDPGVFADREFYLREPANAGEGRFYWSPHAQKVFASVPGQVTVEWVGRVSGETFSQTYTVSGSAVKQPRVIYWTERGFNGPVVNVPEGRVAEVKIVYDDTLFPQAVPEGQDYQARNDPPVDPDNALPAERRTLWYDTLDRSIHAYNREGRVFVELLGDLREPDRVYREHLGFELVDVVQETRPDELRVNVGERVLPVDARDLTAADEALVAEVVAGGAGTGRSYLHEHISLGGTRRDLYAVRQTRPLLLFDRNGDGVLDRHDEQQSNEVLIYWKEPGTLDLLWPKSYVGYIFKWPEDFLAGDPTEADLRRYYSIYARPSDPAASEAVGVQLDASNNPVLAFQDDPTQRHASISPQNVFVSDPAAGRRSLVRYTDGDHIWFERVFSIVHDVFENYGTTAPATVGARLLPPPGVTNAVGYIRQATGDAFHPGAYIDPYAAGFEAAAAGAIIPVNAVAGNDVLEVWWHQASTPPAGTTFSPTNWPSLVRRYRLAWPETDPDDGLHDEIVLARNDGSGPLGIAAAGSIYRQPDPGLPGYNPNEEHAIMSGGVAWALRDDLNRTTSSEPFVLVEYTAADGRPAVLVRRVVRENALHTLDYDAPVGVILQAPAPLPFLPPPVDDAGVLHNVEVGAPSDVPPDHDGSDVHTAHYDRFTYSDRKGATWIYRGVHDLADEGARGFIMRYRYKTQAEFDFPGLAAPPAPGTIVPYLRPYTNGADRSGGFDGDPVTGEPADVSFTPLWPSNAPVLGVAETLGLAKRGLPGIRGQLSARVLYDQAVAGDLATGAADRARAGVLIDPTRAKTYPLSPGGLAALPASVKTSTHLGKTHFPLLPPHLSQRLTFDPDVGERGALVFVGAFVDAAFGEDYFLPNVMSGEDLATARALAADDDPVKAAWDAAIDGLSTTLETFVEDPRRRGTYIPADNLSVQVGPRARAEIVSDDTAVDSYAVAAAGGGTGFVTVVTGDGEAFTPEASPVAMHVFKVAPPLYRGELKVIASANPLDEKLTLQHSGDFGGDPSDYEFAWVTGQPVNGFPPPLYSFGAQAVLPNGPAQSWRILHNPAAGYGAARAFGFDDSGWADPGNLSANPVVIDDGGGPAANGVTLPNAVLREAFAGPGAAPAELYLSLSIIANDGAAVFINGAEVAVWNVPGRANTVPATPPGTLAGSVLPLVFAVPPEVLQAQNTVTADLYTVSDPGASSPFDLRLDGLAETVDLGAWQDVTDGAKSGSGEAGKLRHIIGGASLFTLTDNWFTVRYRALPGRPAALVTGGSATDPGGWSRWVEPQLAEGWIKRALSGINPFEQRVADLLNNDVNTDVSLVAQAGPRWEGDIALNLDKIDDFGLIEIYETVLRRGKTLSIEGAPPLNVPAANDALLLAAGYLNDLYMLLGNEAFADAANPTIAFDTDGGALGEFNTALFAFKGQLASVLEEELALLRGRDDRLLPGVRTSPVYNRLVWNFTGGINSGQPVYALNYNIQDLDFDGDADAADAARQYPQGHGDAYGHYLTALKVYYGLLRSRNFGWQPRPEAVQVLGQPVSVDYQDERKFAAAAAALSRSAAQALDLTYRRQFVSAEDAGWSHLGDGEVNERTGETRHWGTDDWAARAGQGSYFHWVTANSVLPERDEVHEGIQKVDRTTVPELDEVVAQGEAVQRTLDLADARLNPLGLARGALSFDISPAGIDAGKTHYEQVYERAVAALNNAVFAFDSAKRSTEFLRSQENGLDERRAAIEVQEEAFENRLVEIYGTPYPDDIGPGKTYAQGYAGPDLIHYEYVDTPELFFTPTDTLEEIAVPLEPGFVSRNSAILDYDGDGDGEIDPGVHTVTFSIGARGEFVKPASWTGRRAHPGRVQAAVSDLLAARVSLNQAMNSYAVVLGEMDDLLVVYRTQLDARAESVRLTGAFNTDARNIEASMVALSGVALTLDALAETTIEIGDAIAEAFPETIGTSNDATSPARSNVKLVAAFVKLPLKLGSVAAEIGALELANRLNQLERQLEADLGAQSWAAENRQLIRDLQVELAAFRNQRAVVDVALRAYDQAGRDLLAVVGEGRQVQRERETFRKRAAAIVQGFRTRDFAFRVFRDEALERYGALFDLAARYTFLAARAYDYETGLLDASGSGAAAAFYENIVRARALGVVDAEGQPQVAASETGDPGLAGVLARMDADWSVAETRLGFNNPARYQTRFSLREELFRIVRREEGDDAWRDRLAAGSMANLLDDPDVRRYCMQVGGADGLAVPGLVLPFQTTVTQGFNFFGQPLAGGDHGFSPTSFATKVRAAGIAFDGYVGMDEPTLIAGPLGGIGAVSPGDPVISFDDPLALSATPYVYLVPAGVDSMRSPPLGDGGTVRTWAVEDQAIPLPFNIGDTAFSVGPGFVSAESLSEPAFAPRKHPAFRAVPAGTVFSSAPGFTSARLVGRSVWNSSWKLVIPGDTLLNDPEKGLQIFRDTVTDIQLYLETYSYSGN